MPRNNNRNKPKDPKKDKGGKSQDKQPDGSASSTSLKNVPLMKPDASSKDTSVSRSKSAINSTSKSPLKGKNISGYSSSTENNPCLKSKNDEVKSSLVHSSNEHMEEPIKTIVCQNRSTVATPRQRNSSDSNDVSGDQLTKRLRDIDVLITKNINVERDTKKSFDVLNDHLGSVETKMRIITFILLLILLILIVSVLKDVLLIVTL